MLKITVSGQESSCRIIKLEGKLLHDWVDEVWRLLLDVDEGPNPGLDLSRYPVNLCSKTLYC
jgi:hypothetical protein